MSFPSLGQLPDTGSVPGSTVLQEDSPIHNQSYQLSFADGHVAAMTRNEWNTDWDNLQLADQVKKED